MGPLDQTVLAELVKQAPTAFILGGSLVYALRSFAAALKTTQESFLGFLRDRDREEDVRARLVQAAFDRNTEALGRNTAALDRLESREREEDRRQGERRRRSEHDGA